MNRSCPSTENKGSKGQTERYIVAPLKAGGGGGVRHFAGQSLGKFIKQRHSFSKRLEANKHTLIVLIQKDNSLWCETLNTLLDITECTKRKAIKPSMEDADGAVCSSGGIHYITHFTDSFFQSNLQVTTQLKLYQEYDSPTGNCQKRIVQQCVRSEVEIDGAVECVCV